MNENEFKKAVLNDWGKFLGVDPGKSGSDKTAFVITPETKIYILAGDHRHAEWFASKCRFPRKQWRYVDRPHSLDGAVGVVIYYETFWENPDARWIDDLVRILIDRGRLVEVKQESVLHE